MINKKPFSQIATKLKRAKFGLKDPSLTHPNRDWAIGFMLAVAVFAGGAAWSAYTYVVYREVSVGEVGSSVAEVVVYRESLVKSALATYEERKVEHEKLLESAAGKEQSIETEENPQIEVVNEEVSATTTGEMIPEIEILATTTTEEVMLGGQ